MINPMKYKYLVAIMTADKKAYDITQFVEDVSWEEGENQLAARISFRPRTIKLQREEFLLLPSLGVMQHFCIPIMAAKMPKQPEGK